RTGRLHARSGGAEQSRKIRRLYFNHRKARSRETRMHTARSHIAGKADGSPAIARSAKVTRKVGSLSEDHWRDGSVWPSLAKKELPSTCAKGRASIQRAAARREPAPVGGANKSAGARYGRGFDRSRFRDHQYGHRNCKTRCGGRGSQVSLWREAI